MRPQGALSKLDGGGRRAVGPSRPFSSTTRSAMCAPAGPRARARPPLRPSAPALAASSPSPRATPLLTPPLAALPWYSCANLAVPSHTGAVSGAPQNKRPLIVHCPWLQQGSGISPHTLHRPLLITFDLWPTQVLPCSTGIIGWSLPVPDMLKALPACVQVSLGRTGPCARSTDAGQQQQQQQHFFVLEIFILMSFLSLPAMILCGFYFQSAGSEGFDAFDAAQSIMTTDRYPKVSPRLEQKACIF